MNEQIMRAYAKSLLKNGVALQEGQRLAVRANVEASPFIRLLVEEAYKMGAYNIDVMWEDPIIDRIRVANASDDALSQQHEWARKRRMHIAETGGCILTVQCPDPEAMSGLDPAKVMLHNRTLSLTHREFSDYTRNYKVRWAVAAIPSKAWAKKLFPDMELEDAIERLWQDILRTAYADGEDPCAAWEKHMAELETFRNKLNVMDLVSLHFKNSAGTDFTACLADEGRFIGGNCVSSDGLSFCPNLPTEEVFMVPHRLKVEGVVRNSMPLVYSGNIIDGFELKFCDGKVVEYKAEVGEELLGKLLDSDEGSRYIGECSIVPSTSPIKGCGYLFYNTLFDENAACHLALGNGYPDAVGGEDRSAEAIKSKGMNTSMIHVDFMFGTEDTSCVGTAKDGTQIEILRDGKYVI